MKKILVILLVFMLTLSLIACGGGDSGDGTSGSGDGDKVDAVDVANKLMEDMVIEEAFSTKGATIALKKLGGLEFKDIKPDFAYILDDDTMGNYGDDSSYGHASFFFIKDGSDVTTEEYQAWIKQVFDATAKISDDGHNIQGYSFGDGEIEKSFEEVLDGGFMQVWTYKYNGTLMDVYPGTHYGDFTVSADKVYGDENSQDIGVTLEVAVGMQKSWAETTKDLEDAFEEHGDEIEDALKDFVN